MAEPIRDYAKLARDIIATVGGEENIVSAARCATRLRLVLKETPADAHEKIAAMPAVITVVEKGGQFQVVIGTHVGDVFDVVSKELKLDTKEGAEPEMKQSFVNRVIATMSAVFAPFVYILAAAGLIQGSLIIITQFFPAFANTGTYEVISFISWTPFTFLPIFIAITASKHFGCNTYIAVACCCALVNASWGDMAARIAAGEKIQFLVFNLASTTYTSTVLPPLFLVLVLAYLERFLQKKLPDVIKALATPFLCMIIMVPATILVIGPLSEVVANAIASGYNFLYNNVPALAAVVIGGFWQVVVIFGVHWGVTPMVMANFNNFGCDSFQAFQTIAVVAQAAAAFGVFIKSRSKEFKRVAFSAGLTGIFGITEPAIYGVNLRLKKPFICGCISGAIGALALSFFHSMYYVYAGLPGLLTVVNAISPDNPMSFIGELVGCGVAVVGSIVLIQFVGFDDPGVPAAAVVGVGNVPAGQAAEGRTAVGQSDSETTGNAGNAAVSEITVYSPMNGEVKALSEVDDPTFSSGMLGQGMAIIPADGNLYAPVDGTVASIFGTKHALGMVDENGMELLMHIGLETVSLNGKYFEAHVNVDDKVKKGDLLITFDLEEIKKDFDTITPIMVSNMDRFSGVDAVKAAGAIKAGEALMTVKR